MYQPDCVDEYDIQNEKIRNSYFLPCRGHVCSHPDVRPPGNFCTICVEKMRIIRPKMHIIFFLTGRWTCKLRHQHRLHRYIRAQGYWDVRSGYGIHARGARERQSRIMKGGGGEGRKPKKTLKSDILSQNPCLGFSLNYSYFIVILKS